MNQDRLPLPPPPPIPPAATKSTPPIPPPPPPPPRAEATSSAGRLPASPAASQPSVVAEPKGIAASGRELKLTDIQCEAGTQIRASINEEVVAEYAERMSQGNRFPPVDTFFDGKQYYLVDGFHRVLACRRAKVPTVECNIHLGTLTDGIWFAIGANGKNGLHRSAADTQHAIEVAVAKFPQKTQQQIAEQVGCDRSYVAKVSAQLVNIHKFEVPDTRQGRDGKKRPARYKPRKKSTLGKALPA
jgi:hypothetical protein